MKDKNALQDFVAATRQMNRWREIKAGGEILYIGADNYPFPIPLREEFLWPVVLRHRSRKG